MSDSPIEYHPYMPPYGRQVSCIAVPQSEFVRAKGRAGGDISILYAGASTCAAVVLIESSNRRGPPAIVFAHVDDGEPVVSVIRILMGDEALIGKKYHALVFSGMPELSGIAPLAIGYLEKRGIPCFVDLRTNTSANFAIDLETGFPLAMEILPNQSINKVGVDFIAPPLLLEIPRYVPNRETEKKNMGRIVAKSRAPRMKLAFDLRKGQLPMGYTKMMPSVPIIDRVKPGT